MSAIDVYSRLRGTLVDFKASGGIEAVGDVESSGANLITDAGGLAIAGKYQVIPTGMISIVTGANKPANQINFAAADTLHDDANSMATALGMVADAWIQSTPTNPVAVSSAVVSAGHVVITLTGAPGAGGCVVYYRLINLQ